MIINQINHLPHDISFLSDTAKEEGFKFIARLIEAYQSKNSFFSNLGEAFFEVRDTHNVLIGIGGVTQDIFSRQNIGRLRRFYIHPQYRRLNIGSHLLNHIENFSKNYFSEITLYTDMEAAALFYEKHGYIYTIKPKQTHYKILAKRNQHG